MKKIKYVLGLFVFGFGLLFNQSFGNNSVNLELVSLPYSTNSFQTEESMLFHSSIGFNNQWPSACGRFPVFGGFTYIDGVQSNFVEPWNGSYLGYTPFNTFAFCNGYTNMSNSNELALYIGQDSDFGNNFIGSYLSTWIDTGVYGPVYGFGDNFYSISSSYSSYHGDTMPSYVRFFYETNTLTKQFSNMNFLTLTGSQQSKVKFYQIMKPFGFIYQYSGGNQKNFSDIGSNYQRKMTFGGYGAGYSFIYNTSLETNSVSWSDLRFVTLGSVGLETLMQFGDSSIVDRSKNVQTLGILALKGVSYASKYNNGSVLLLSKNPNNYSQVLYEQFDCALDDIQTMILTGNYCNSISHGYITINGTGNVLPFSSQSLTYNIGGGNSFIDFLFNGGDFGYVYINNNQYCLSNGTQNLCFSLQSTPNQTSLSEQYLSLGSLNTSISDIMNSRFADLCFNSSNFSVSNLALCNYYRSILNNPVALGSGYYYYTSPDGHGGWQIEIVDQAGLFSGTYQGTGVVWIQDSSGNRVTNCDGGWCNPNPDNSSGSVFLTGDGTNGYYLGSGYYDIRNNVTGFFFKCPYPYEHLFTLGGWDLQIGNFDIVLPVNCFIGAFNYGSSLDFLDEVGLFNFGPLIQGDTKLHRILFRFFDILLCIGIFVFFSFISKLIK